MAPMYHTNGFATLFSLLAGDHLVVLQKFDAARIVDLIEAHGVTTFTATTMMLQRIADLPDIEQRDLSSLEWILQGAAAISPSLVHRWIDLVGAEKVYQSYGMTEGIGLCAIRGDEWLAHPGSVGRGFRGDRDPHPRRRRAQSCPRARSARSTCARRAAACSTTSAARRCRRAPSTASPPAATWASSNPRATCTSSTGAST